MSIKAKWRLRNDKTTQRWQMRSNRLVSSSRCQWSWRSLLLILLLVIKRKGSSVTKMTLQWQMGSNPLAASSCCQYCCHVNKRNGEAFREIRMTRRWQTRSNLLAASSRCHWSMSSARVTHITRKHNIRLLLRRTRTWWILAWLTPLNLHTYAPLTSPTRSFIPGTRNPFNGT